MARDTGPPTSATWLGEGENVRPVVQAQKARLAETELPPRFLRDFLASLLWHFDCRGSFPSERSEMPITGIALRGVWGQRTFVTAASLLELPMGNMSKIWLSSVCAIHINKTVISIRPCYINCIFSNRNDYVSVS